MKTEHVSLWEFS